MKKVFIDGKDGTTGLKIYSRFENRQDIELLLIDSEKHKHLKEMKAISGLSKEPIFSPIVCDYPQGMVVSIPLFTNKMTKNTLLIIYVICSVSITAHQILLRSVSLATRQV